MRLPAVLGLTLLCGAFLFGTAAAAGPDIPSAEQVHRLVQQLDDARFPARRDADRELRRLGIGVVPLLRLELEKQLPLEVTRRVEAIIDDLGQLKWHGDRAEAQREAAATGRPLLVYATLGKPGTIVSRSTKAMELRTFGDLELVEYLNKNFVLLWENRLDVEGYAALHGLILNREPEHFRPEQVMDYAEGRGGDSARTYFCTADGKVVYQLSGFWKAPRYLAEARFARDLIGSSSAVLEPGQAETVRRRLADRVQRLEQSAVEGSAEWRVLLNCRAAMKAVAAPVLPLLDGMHLGLSH